MDKRKFLEIQDKLEEKEGAMIFKKKKKGQAFGDE